MSNRIYDASQLTKRRAEKAIAGSFLSRMYPPSATPGGNPVRQPQLGSAPLLGIYDNSIMNAVKTGHQTEYTRFPTCVGISAGCPCPELNESLNTRPFVPAIPGEVTGITFTIGSIILKWNAPKTGDGPFSYRITPYLNGQAGTPVFTGETTYRFTDLIEWQPYTFTVCAMNTAGSGPVIPSSTYFLAPPNTLSTVMSGSSTPVTPEPLLKYIMNAGLDSMLHYIASVNLGPTRGSRYIYVWITSIVGAWNWIRSESRVSGVHDNWNWSSKSTTPLNDNDSIIWLCEVIDYITPFFIPSGYKSIYNCPTDVVTRVKNSGEWDKWQQLWQSWFNYRQNDGHIQAVKEQPISSANWNETIVVDGTTVSDIANFPKPQEWTRLTVQGKKQGYLTYNWISVLSTCLTQTDEINIINNVAPPAMGIERDAEIDAVKDIAATLTDKEKVIAEFWAGGPGTVSPPLMCIWFWKEYMRIIDISCPNIMFSLLDLAINIFEISRITWELKTKYMESRPIQEIRRRYAGQQIASWNGQIDGSQWIPYQEANFVSPPFADFPSGHSSFSKSFALTMNKWFGDNIERLPTFYDRCILICPMLPVSMNGVYGVFPIEPNTGLIEKNIPSNKIVLSFNKWDDIAAQAGVSRFYGGIHAITAHTSSQQSAIMVNSDINSTWNIQTA